MTEHPLIAQAHRIANTILFPAAPEVDRTGEIPQAHWRALADAGLYGIALPAAQGGPDLDIAGLVDILEIISSGCLATAFTWVQHHGMLAALVLAPMVHAVACVDATLVAARALSDNVRELVFERAGGAPLDFLPGQWVNVLLRPPDAEREGDVAEVKRAYSIASAMSSTWSYLCISSG